MEEGLTGLAARENHRAHDALEERNALYRRLAKVEEERNALYREVCKLQTDLGNERTAWGNASRAQKRKIFALETEREQQNACLSDLRAELRECRRFMPKLQFEMEPHAAPFCNESE